jgi:hypothetical protein
MSPAVTERACAYDKSLRLRIALVRSSPQMIRACRKFERKMLSNECLWRDFCDRRFSCNEWFDLMLRLLLHPPLPLVSFRCMWFSIVQKRVRGC